MGLEIPLPRLQRAVLRWYTRHARSLWWRRLSPEPYQVLVTELMLQQTQAQRVERVLPRFFQRFPTIRSVAEAPLAEVIRWWQGLGYNRRARFLWECAQTIVQHYGGCFPSELEQLRRLPGVGAYTAAAIATFAFGRQDVPVLDTNVRRVLQRILGTEHTSARELERIAREWLPGGASAQWHQALMDVGALYCHKHHPRCSECPLRRYCRSAGRVPPSARSMQRCEPSFAGIPRRLWRGRLLRLVAVAGTVTTEQAAQRLFGERPTGEQQRWIEELVAHLVRDGLLCRQGSWLSLPDGL
ncbi:MAG: A/G-specific adenine glycosylase [Candidatus Kapabacteria bacterium]|nr:A/G-specific adenine glycosylase [Candidatus Kapabacteria bacterium]MCS7169282.1 A/G-specific adenine glycosylase [Candidatus Kapabacteria bacterium]MDW7997691.1 A/G-specific adenine glycosylase [Bacteroidota bacterium]MDW8224558.1 A/G-specific adenine glycosylase [Bacteroidota bacterium]